MPYFFLDENDRHVTVNRERYRGMLEDYTGLQGFVVEKLWVVSRVIFDVESEFEIRISLSRQDIEIFEVMCSKNGSFHYF